MSSKKYPSVRPKGHKQDVNVAMNYPPPTDRDKWLKLFQGPGGTLRHIKDPEMRKLILKRGGVKA